MHKRYCFRTSITPTHTRWICTQIRWKLGNDSRQPHSQSFKINNLPKRFDSIKSSPPSCKKLFVLIDFFTVLTFLYICLNFGSHDQDKFLLDCKVPEWHWKVTKLGDVDYCADFLTYYIPNQHSMISRWFILSYTKYLIGLHANANLQ